MLAFDTETSGVGLMNGCTTFSIGVYDGHRFRSSTVDVDPVTRARIKEHSKELRRSFDSADLLVAHNAKFDIRALCEAGLYSWDEPNSPEFWKRIVDTTQLAHLYCSTDDLGLDKLTKRYLGRSYQSEKDLLTVVNKCRSLTRRKAFLKEYGKWTIAEFEGPHQSFEGLKKNTEWNRMDYWLPAAVMKHIPESFRPTIPNRDIQSVLQKYLKDDCVNTFELAEFYFHELTERHGDDLERLLAINRDIEHVIWKMEVTGVHINVSETEAAIGACEHFIQLLSRKCHDISKLDHITDTRLRTLFFEKWELEPVGITPGGVPQVDAKTLLKLHTDSDPATPAHEFLSCYLSLKKYQKKLQSLKTYLKLRDSNGYLHTSYNSTGTKTTRFTSYNPNLQQVTKAGNPYEDDSPEIARWLKASPSMRSCFGPAKDRWWISADYSQLQLRIFAYVTNEQDMIEAFNNGWDAHNYVACKIFNTDKPTKAQRRVAKNVNFGFLFGSSPRKIEQTAGIPGLWSTVTELFPNAHRFIEETKDQIREHGRIYTLGNYPLELKDYINKHTGRMEKAAHAGVNYIIQGAEGVIVKHAMRLCDDYLTSEYPEGRLVMQVHDELDFDIPAYAPKRHVANLKSLMETAAARYGIIAPVEANLITKRWDKEVRIAL